MNKDIKINQPPVLFDKTQKLIPELEKKLGGPFLTYWNSTGGGV